jgi:hypothetical protein
MKSTDNHLIIKPKIKRFYRPKGIPVCGRVRYVRVACAGRAGQGRAGEA